MKAKKQPPRQGRLHLCWRKPIFPGRHQPSIFGTSELNFRVRDGNGWTLAVINTNYCRPSWSSFNMISQVFGKCKPFFEKNRVFLHFHRIWGQAHPQPPDLRAAGIWKIKKNRPVDGSLCVGENLFSRAVTSQVSSARASLTSVFGMGTGGPSP